MSSKLFKTVFAGAVTVGALLLPVSAAQAAPKHNPCNDPGFSDGAFFGDGFGFQDDGFGFRDDGLGFRDGGFRDGGFGFHHHRRHHDTTTIIIVADHHKKKHHHKPAPTGNGASTGYQKPADAGYKPADPGNSASGYHKGPKGA